jgi:hypothetical protein
MDASAHIIDVNVQFFVFFFSNLRNNAFLCTAKVETIFCIFVLLI